MPLFVGLFVEAKRLLAVGPVRDDRLRAAIFEALAQLGAIVGFVAQEFLRRFATTNEAFRRGTIVGLAAGQEDGKNRSGGWKEDGL